MDEKRLISAFSDMMDTKLKQALDPIKQDLSEMKQDISGLKREMSEVKQDISGLKQEMSEVKQDISEIKKRVKKIEITQENVIIKNIRLIFETQQDIIVKFRRLDHAEKVLEEVRSDTQVMKSVIAEHSQAIRELRAAK